MLIFNLKKKKVEFGTFMCCTIIEILRTFLMPVWTNGVRNSPGLGKRHFVHQESPPAKLAGVAGLPRPDGCLHPPQTSAGFFQSYSLSINGKLFLSKNMQNTLEGNCKTFRIRETYFDDF